jgi:hypothetical protein
MFYLDARCTIFILFVPVENETFYLYRRLPEIGTRFDEKIKIKYKLQRYINDIIPIVLHDKLCFCATILFFIN